MLKLIFIILFSEIWNTAGQVFLKKGADAIKTDISSGIRSYSVFIKEAVSQPFVWFGMISLAIGLGVWCIALALADLSLVYPIGSLQYILILISSRIFLKEKLDLMRILGTVCVVIGIIMIVNS